MRDRLPYEVRQLIVTIVSFLVSALPAVIAARVVFDDVKLPEKEMTPGKMVSIATVISAVLVALILFVTLYRTIIAFIRRHIGIVCIPAIAAVYGIITTIQKYTVLLEPIQKVFYVWLWSSLAAVVASIVMSIFLGVGWRVKQDGHEHESEKRGQ